MPRTTTTPGSGSGSRWTSIAHPDADPLPPGVAAARAVVVITKTTTAPGTPLTGVRGEDGSSTPTPCLRASAPPGSNGPGSNNSPGADRRPSPPRCGGAATAALSTRARGAAVQQQRRRRRDVARRRGRPLRRRRRRQRRRRFGGLRLGGRFRGGGGVPDREMTEILAQVLELEEAVLPSSAPRARRRTSRFARSRLF